MCMCPKPGSLSNCCLIAGSLQNGLLGSVLIFIYYSQLSLPEMSLLLVGITIID